MKGILYGVSVGPGDPELITLKSVRIIKSSSIVAVPRTNGENSMALEIVQKVCDISKKQILFLDFLMSEDKNQLLSCHKAIAQRLFEYLENGHDVAFLNIGDVSVYSTFSYIAPLVEKMGANVKMCSGVTSFCAAAAAAKIPLVQGKESLTVMPSADVVLKNNGTVVVMKSGKNLSDVKSELKKNGYNTVYAINDCGLENEKIYIGIENIPKKCGYFTVVIAKNNV